MREPSDQGASGRGSQTLIRGLDIVDLVAKSAPISLKDLTEQIGLTRSTTHRLASALVERNMLCLDATGYRLGAKLLQLDARARRTRSLLSVARPHIELLARDYLDPVNLAVREDEMIRYLDQIRGSRRIEVRSVIGETRPLACTGLGKALLFDASEAEWRSWFRHQVEGSPGARDEAAWMAAMTRYRQQGAAFDIEENADKVRCVAAPIRDASGRIVAALSLSSLPQYLDDARMAALVEPVKAVARIISIELGGPGD